MKKNPLSRGLLASLILTLSFVRVEAQTYIERADNSDDISTTGAWNGGVVPTSTTVAEWDTNSNINSDGDAATSSTTDTNLDWDGIDIDSPGEDITITAPNLTLQGYGINVTGNNLTLTDAVNVSVTQEWSVDAGHQIDFVTGTNAFNTSSTANVTLNGTATSQFVMGGFAGAGTTTLTGGATLAFTGRGGTGSTGFNLDGASLISIALDSNNVETVSYTNGGTTLTYNYTGEQTAVNSVVNIEGTNNYIGGAIVDPVTLNGTTYTSSNPVYSAGFNFVNGFTGSGTVNFVPLAVSTIYINGSMSTFTGTMNFSTSGAQPGKDANIIFGSTFEGTNSLTFEVGALDQVNIAATTSDIGALTGTGEIYGNPSGSDTVMGTLDIGGANTADTFDGTLTDREASANSVLAIDKVGTGTLILASDSTLKYGGTTTVTAGTLQIDSTLNTSEGFSVAHGATLQGTGGTGGIGAQTAPMSGLSVPGLVVDGTLIGGDNNGTSAGNMLIKSDLTLNLDSTLYSNAFASGSADKLTLSGSTTTATLNGGTLILNLHYTAVAGDSFTLISVPATTAITGSFGTVDIEDNGVLTGDTGTFNDTTGLFTITSISSGAVPEPNAAALLVMGAGFLAFFQISRRRRLTS